MLLRQRHEGVHVAGHAVEVHRDDGLRLFGDLLLDGFRVQVIGHRVDVREDRHGAGLADGLAGGYEGEGGGDDLVPGLYAGCDDRHPDGVGAVGHAYGVFGSVMGGEFFLKFSYFLSKDEIGLVENGFYGRLYLFSYGGVSCQHVYHWYFHDRPP
jgi:hypothetical protein